MIKGDKCYRVEFYANFQKELFGRIRKQIGYGWNLQLSRILNKSGSIVSRYSSGDYTLSLSQLNKICQRFKFNENSVKLKIKKLNPPNWGSIKAAKVTNSLHANRLSEWGRKGAYKIQELYPKERLKWIEKGMMNAGKVSAAVQPPNFFETKIIRVFKGLQYELHKTIEAKDEYFNIDIIVNSLPIEVLGDAHSKGDFFFKILETVHKSNTLKKRFFIVVKHYRDYPDAILLAIAEGLVPVSFAHLKLLKSYVTEKNTKLIRELIKVAKDESLKYLKKQHRQMYSAAIREKLRLNKSERAVSKHINKLNPRGKVILKSPYGTYTVPDNYFEAGNNKYLVLISESKNVRYRIRNHAGYSYMIKKLYGKEYKVCSIIITNKPMQIKSGKYFRFYEKYIDMHFIGKLNELNPDLLTK